MQLTAAAVTPPAEHAARQPAGAADAAAADADVRREASGYYEYAYYLGADSTDGLHCSALAIERR